MRRKAPLQKMDLAHQKEEEKTKAMEKEEGMTKKCKKKEPPIGIDTLQKRKASPEKPLARKKTCANKPKMKATLIEDEIDLIITAVEDDSEDIL
jgi:hypothetical protein